MRTKKILRHLKLWDRPERPPPCLAERSTQYDEGTAQFDEASQWPHPGGCDSPGLLSSTRPRRHRWEECGIAAPAREGGSEARGCAPPAPPDRFRLTPGPFPGVSASFPLKPGTFPGPGPPIPAILGQPIQSNCLSFTVGGLKSEPRHMTMRGHSRYQALL